MLGQEYDMVLDLPPLPPSSKPHSVSHFRFHEQEVG